MRLTSATWTIVASQPPSLAWALSQDSQLPAEHSHLETSLATINSASPSWRVNCYCHSYLHLFLASTHSITPDQKWNVRVIVTVFPLLDTMTSSPVVSTYWHVFEAIPFSQSPLPQSLVQRNFPSFLAQSDGQPAFRLSQLSLFPTPVI